MWKNATNLLYCEPRQMCIDYNYQIRRKLNIVNFVIIGIVGRLFEKEKNAAYTMYEAGVSLGFVISFTAGLVFMTVVHLWIIFALIVYGCISYTMLAIAKKYYSRHSKIDEGINGSSLEMKERDF